MDVPEHSARQQIECVHAALSSSWNPTQDRDSDQTRENQSVDDLCQRGSRRVESCVQPVDGAVTGRPARQCDDLEVSALPQTSLHSLERPLMPAGFPDHELLVGANGDLQLGVLAFTDEKVMVSFDPLAGRPEVCYSIMGSATEFPSCPEIPISLVRQAVKEFLLSGGRQSTCIEWQEPEFW
ncbi:Imm1 family immunity protein [Streptomyces sp. enrichment culture]|uniref:Imm1 family immunity protein n=1 Tax=Streptomyces sp. enrichment culture TaxID=1795815 RepID=UPI003F54891C